jgi:DNA-binding response OmpR family regulator
MERNGRGRVRTALVVDDDPRCRALVEATLREYGFEVLSVGDGYRATAVIARAQELELLVVDTEMPGMHGWAVIRYAKAKHRKVRVLRLGRVDDEAPGAEYAPLCGLPTLSKPFAATDLLQRVRSRRTLLSP